MSGDDAEHGMGWRVPPPERGARIAWPDDLGTRFTLFVDTEEEFDWSAPLSRGARATTAIAALPDGHRRFTERGIPVTYLVDHPIATSPAAVEILCEAIGDGRSTVGTQLHPWVNPPFDEALVRANSYPGNLPRAIEAAKLDVLTEAIVAAFGIRPRIYRAGRYGIGRATAALLAERGYRLDSSIRARYDYRGDGGPDFGAIASHAFWLDADRQLLELPLTTVFTGAGRRGGEGFYRLLGRVPHGRGAAARLGLLARVALTPEDMPVADALEAVRVAAGEGVRVLNFAFHSPSLAPGNTPYVRDQADLAKFHAWWDRVLDLLDRLGVAPIGADALIAAAEATREPRLPPQPRQPNAGARWGL